MTLGGDGEVEEEEKEEGKGGVLLGGKGIQVVDGHFALKEGGGGDRGEEEEEGGYADLASYEESGLEGGEEVRPTHPSTHLIPTVSSFSTQSTYSSSFEPPRLPPPNPPTHLPPPNRNTTLPPSHPPSSSPT